MPEIAVVLRQFLIKEKAEMALNDPSRDSLQTMLDKVENTLLVNKSL